MSQLIFPTLRKKQQITCQIETKLLQSVKKACKEREITLRAAIEYGLQAFLVATNKEDKPK